VGYDDTGDRAQHLQHRRIVFDPSFTAPAGDNILVSGNLARPSPSRRPGSWWWSVGAWRARRCAGLVRAA